MMTNYRFVARWFHVWFGAAAIYTTIYTAFVVTTPGKLTKSQYESRRWLGRWWLVALFDDKDYWDNYAKGLISYHGHNHYDVAGCTTYCLNIFFRKISARRAFWEEVPTMQGSTLRVFFRTADISQCQEEKHLNDWWLLVTLILLLCASHRCKAGC